MNTPDIAAEPIERKAIPFEVKAVADDGAGHGYFEGVGAAFLNIDGVGDIIAPGAFKGGLDEFVRSGFIGNIGHDWSSPIGHPAAAEERADGLYIKAVFDGSPEAQSARARMTVHPQTGRATVRKLSIGYKTLESRMLNGPDEVKAYWQGAGYTPSASDLERAESGARLLTRLKTYEVSPVLVPANDLAQVTGAKSDPPAAPADKSGYAETSRKVASAARESLEGFERLATIAERHAEVRLKEGRVISDANRSVIQGCIDAHDEMIGQHKALRDRLAGVLEQTRAKSDPDPPAVAAPAIDQDAITQRIRTTLARTSLYVPA